MIKLQVIGHLGRDAQVNNVNGKNVINFTVAHSERFKDAQGNQKDRTIWVDCAYWTDRTAVAPYLKKGTQVYAEGQPDVRLRFERGRWLRIECKNVLRQTAAGNVPRVDFQRTRAAKSDPCSRYYRPGDFDVVAACLHAVTEKWEFRYVLPSHLEPHGKCRGKLASNVRVDGRWTEDAQTVLRAVG